MAALVHRETVMSELRRAVAETLQLDEADVLPSSSLVADLGAASLDFLDFNYRLEQAFGLRMARYFFLEHAEELLGEGSAVDDHGRLTELGMALLRRRYGDDAAPANSRRLRMDAVPALVTVATIVDSVMEILDTLPARCACGAGAWRSDDGARVVCGACQSPAPYLDGDELLRRWLSEHARDAEDAPDRSGRG